MTKKKPSIPIDHFGDEHSLGISIEKVAVKDLLLFSEANEAHRHDFHSFFLLETGSVSMEIDFKKHNFQAPALIYIHPNQVHLINAFKNVRVSTCAINNENLHPGYLELLESITPAKPLALKKETYTIIREAISLCLKFSERRNDRLYYSLLKDSCNALVALMISQYLERSKPADKLTRFETVNKAFNSLLERHYTTAKRPAEYAKKLNISTSYLNECVNNTTGHSVSHQIQQRVILEAKRLLYHSGKSVKEIAAELGYDDYPYFSRLFTKVTGMPALAFRNKNHE